MSLVRLFLIVFISFLPALALAQTWHEKPATLEIALEQEFRMAGFNVESVHIGRQSIPRAEGRGRYAQVATISFSNGGRVTYEMKPEGLSLISFKRSLDFRDASYDVVAAEALNGSLIIENSESRPGWREYNEYIKGMYQQALRANAGRTDRNRNVLKKIEDTAKGLDLIEINPGEKDSVFEIRLRSRSEYMEVDKSVIYEDGKAYPGPGRQVISSTVNDVYTTLQLDPKEALMFAEVVRPKNGGRPQIKVVVHHAQWGAKMKIYSIVTNRDGNFDLKLKDSFDAPAIFNKGPVRFQKAAPVCARLVL